MNEMRTLGERVDRIEEAVEVTETKPDVTLLNAGVSIDTTNKGEQDNLGQARGQQTQGDQNIGKQIQKGEEQSSQSQTEESEDTLALTSGKLKLKIKTEGGKRYSKVISEDKENINMKEKEALINGEPVLPSEKVKVDSVALTPLSTSERAIDALRRQQNRTPSCTTNSEADSGTLKDEVEQSSEAGCDLFSEPETEKLDENKPDVIPGENQVTLPEKLAKPEPPTPKDSVKLTKKTKAKSKVTPGPAAVSRPGPVSSMKSKVTPGPAAVSRPGPASSKKKLGEQKRKKNIVMLGPKSKRISLRLKSADSESDKSGLTNGHLDESREQDVNESFDPDEFQNPQRSQWLPDSKDFPRCVRYKCPYCVFTNIKRHVVDDHIIIEHSIQGTSKMVPKYGEATKQQMLLLVERDPQLLTKYHEDLLFCEAPMSILEEVSSEEVKVKIEFTTSQGVNNHELMHDSSSSAEELHQEEEVGLDSSNPAEVSFTSDMSLVEETGAEEEWQQCDATLPNGWQFQEVKLQNGSLRKAYQSPCGKRLKSRDTIAEFLLGQNLDILHPTGFRETFCLPGLPTSCPGFCEGGCPALKIHPLFFSPEDPNQRRRQFKIKFVTDLNVEKVREVKKERFSGSSKKEAEVRIDPVRYGIPLIRAERPWIIFVDQRTNEEKQLDSEREEVGKITECLDIKQENPFFEPDEGFGTPIIEAAYELPDEDYKESLSKLEEIKSSTTGEKRKQMECDDKVSAKRRRDSGSKDELSFRAIRGDDSPSEINTKKQGRGRGGGGRRNMVSPATDRQAALAERGLKVSKERSYLKQVERKTRSESPSEEEEEEHSQIDRSYEPLDDEEVDGPIQTSRLKQPARGPTTQDLKKRKNVEALKKLQKQDLEENRTGGTYVQCCNQKCAKWRLVPEYLEPTQVQKQQFSFTLCLSAGSRALGVPHDQGEVRRRRPRLHDQQGKP